MVQPILHDRMRAKIKSAQHELSSKYVTSAQICIPLRPVVIIMPNCALSYSKAETGVGVMTKSEHSEQKIRAKQMLRFNHLPPHVEYS